MSEVYLAAMAGSSNDHIDAKTTPMQEVNQALQACSFGRFHLRLLFAVMVAITAGVLVTNTTPYLLPMAECDLNMGLVEKGILNAAPFVGMLFSSVVAGFLTDTFGRKIFIVGGNFGMFLSMVVAGTSQTYEVLIAAKFFDGFVFASSIGAVVVHVSEFAHKGIIDITMMFQSSCRASAQIYIGLMSWGVFVNDWRVTLFDNLIVLNTWNFYLYLMSLWSLSSCILYCFLPESPKYLVSQQKYDEARQVLIDIYTENTGKSAESFPYANLWKSKVKQVIDEAPEIKAESTISHQIVVGLHNIKPMFKKPLLYYLLAICFINFCVMFTYNVIRLWFPQLSTIVEHYNNEEGTNDLCYMLDSYTSDLKNRRDNFNETEVCVPTKSGTETYVNSIILGCVCIIPYLISGILVNKLGKKVLQVAAGLISISILFGLRFANSKVLLVLLFSIGTAAAQTIMSLTQAITVEIFPTTTRTLAIAFYMTLGRIGSLVGNVAFPILLNIGCVQPFYTLAGMMIAATLLVFFIPSKKK